jgi:hypothetical protein
MCAFRENAAQDISIFLDAASAMHMSETAKKIEVFFFNSIAQ